jgi:hypothetical protein
MVCLKYFPKFTTSNDPRCENCEHFRVTGCINRTMQSTNKIY